MLYIYDITDFSLPDYKVFGINHVLVTREPKWRLNELGSIEAGFQTYV